MPLQRPSLPAVVLGWLLASAIPVGLTSACSLPSAGAADASLARAKSEASQGADLFATSCAGCHAERGEGIGSNPPVMGAGALPEIPRSNSDGQRRSADPAELQSQYQTRPPGAPSREPFRNAQDVFDFVSKNMPPKSPGSLESDEYWAIINFILTAHGTPVPSGGINPGNASQVPVHPE